MKSILLALSILLTFPLAVSASSFTDLSAFPYASDLDKSALVTKIQINISNLNEVPEAADEKAVRTVNWGLFLIGDAIAGNIDKESKRTIQLMVEMNTVMENNKNPCFVAGWQMERKKNGKCPAPNDEKHNYENKSFDKFFLTSQFHETHFSSGHPKKTQCSNVSGKPIMCNPIIYGYRNHNLDPLCVALDEAEKGEDSCLSQSQNSISKGYGPEERFNDIIKVYTEQPLLLSYSVMPITKSCLCPVQLEVQDMKWSETMDHYKIGEKEDTDIETSYFNPFYLREYDKEKHAVNALENYKEQQNSLTCLSLLNQISHMNSKIMSCEESLGILSYQEREFNNFTNALKKISDSELFGKAKVGKDKRETRALREGILKKLKSDNSVKQFCERRNLDQRKKQDECSKDVESFERYLSLDEIEELKVESKAYLASFGNIEPDICDQENFISNSEIAQERYKKFYCAMKPTSQDCMDKKYNTQSPRNLGSNAYESQLTSISKSKKASASIGGGFWSGIGNFFSGAWDVISSPEAITTGGKILEAGILANQSNSENNLALAPTYLNGDSSAYTSSTFWNANSGNQFTYTGSIGQPGVN